MTLTPHLIPTGFDLYQITSRHKHGAKWWSEPSPVGFPIAGLCATCGQSWQVAKGTLRRCVREYRAIIKKHPQSFRKNKGGDWDFFTHCKVKG